MPQFYAEILRSPGPHDNSFRLLNSNDPSPSTIAWAKDIGVTATSAGNILLHYAYLCGNTPIQLSQKDAISGSVTRSSLGTDHAELRLNNYRGKFFSSVNAFSFGDHLHIYLGQGSEPFHIYGGEME